MIWAVAQAGCIESEPEQAILPGTRKWLKIGDFQADFATRLKVTVYDDGSGVAQNYGK